MKIHEIKNVGAGGVVYYTTGPTRRDLINSRLASIGLSDHELPERTDAAALRTALTMFCHDKKDLSQGLDLQVQPRKKHASNGYEVLAIQRGEGANGYGRALAAKVENGDIQVLDGDLDRTELRRLFQWGKDVLPGTSISSMLAKLIVDIGGLALRPSGGVYWIPEHSLELWQRVAWAVETSATESNPDSDKPVSQVYLVKVRAFDEDTVKAVKGALVAEIEGVLSHIEADVASGELKHEALSGRATAAGKLHDRIKEFESLVQEQMSFLHDAVYRTQQAALMASMQALGVDSDEPASATP